MRHCGRRWTYISTHSLTKRLTGIKTRLSFFYVISTHSLTKRLTYSCSAPDGTKNFNSQPHEEADCCGSCVIYRPLISTHSLTKRLTQSGRNSQHQAGHFNSQPHEEADGNFRQKYIYLKLFFTLIAHINLVFYSNHYIVNFFLVKYTHFLVRMS